MPTRSIAYFSMEMALHPDMPTYSGGLGALAGDTIRSAADLRLPMVGVTLVHRKGFFNQILDSTGWQHEDPVDWPIDQYLTEMSERVELEIAGSKVKLRIWRYEAEGTDGYKVPVYLLDSDVDGNEEWHRTLTHYLYGGDHYYRLCQEAVLGIGGVRALRALGYRNVHRWHMNEGHASLLTIELLREAAEKAGRQHISHDDVEWVRDQCIFTTHTPVESGHDKFPLDVAARVIGLGDDLLAMKDVICCDGALNMTYLAMNLSHYVNGVARRHGETSRNLFQGYAIDAITNGVHAATWAAPPLARLYDKHLEGWRQDAAMLRGVLGIGKLDVWEAHKEAKRELIKYVNEKTNAGMNEEDFTLGFARRAAPYKRGALLVSDVERLRAIARDAGKIQIIYGGKAHPNDQTGKGIIQRIFKAIEALKDIIKIVYLPNYDARLAKLLTSGVDLWVNTPQPPLEASGTSGMKAAINGVPSLSVLDGWWVEGHIENVTGWAIGNTHRGVEGRDDWVNDANSLYNKLETLIIPMFYQETDRYIDVMRHCIAINGSFFNTHRMLRQYVMKAYF